MEQILEWKRERFFGGGFPPLPGLEEERLQGGLAAGRSDSARVRLLILLPHSTSPRFWFCLSFLLALALAK